MKMAINVLFVCSPAIKFLVQLELSVSVIRARRLTSIYVKGSTTSIYPIRNAFEYGIDGVWLLRKSGTELEKSRLGTESM